MQLCLFPTWSPIPDDARPIPNFDGDYLITPDGEVWSVKWGGVRKKRTFRGPGGPRVCLSRFNRRWRPDVATLLRATFGIANDKPRSDAQLFAELEDEYANDPEIRAWIEAKRA